MKEIGHTGIFVGPLSFGASSLGGVFHRVRETIDWNLVSEVREIIGVRHRVSWKNS